MGRGRGSNPFRGKWRIIETEVWDSDALDLVVPAHITFGDDGLGEMELIAIGASIDYRVVDRGGERYVEFSWSGYDDSHRACGRGWARLEGDLLKGEFFVHQGDNSTFVGSQTHGKNEDSERDPGVVGTGRVP